MTARVWRKRIGIESGGMAAAAKNKASSGGKQQPA